MLVYYHGTFQLQWRLVCDVEVIRGLASRDKVVLFHGWTVDALRTANCDDGEILEVNQVVAYFNYSNRLLNGLGVTTEGDAVGYYK